MSAVTAAPWDVPTQPTVRRLSLVPALPVAPARSVRGGITRRGRLVLTCLVAVVLALLVGAIGRALLTGSADTSYGQTTVRSGQTLSEVAHRAYPGMYVPDAVQRVQAANSLSSSHVVAGQVLRLPH